MIACKFGFHQWGGWFPAVQGQYQPPTMYKLGLVPLRVRFCVYCGQVQFAVGKAE